jgi:hypothetical protein
MPTKALRLQIIKPYNNPNTDNQITWDELGTILRNLRYACSKMANYVMRRLYLWEDFKINYKKENGSYPNKQEYKEMWYLYPKLVSMFPDVPGQIISQLERYSQKKWASSKKDILSLRQSLPTFKLNFPIIVHNESYSIISVDNNSFIINAQLGSKKTFRTRYTLIIGGHAGTMSVGRKTICHDVARRSELVGDYICRTKSLLAGCI